ncbi:MAG: SMP-30/gluconolactonase/LRE family protein [Bacteroidetes bacterium]|jgi:sugar lactone lactonase YvrE|nr:SMP-30/gluconolactonase/LRE family protein [Bacteroidota bacterium]
MTSKVHANLEFQTAAHLGEGPVWDEINQKLWWVDILGCTLNCYDPESKKNKSFDAGEHIGAAVLRKEGGLVLALQSGLAFFDETSETITPVKNNFTIGDGTRSNDGKCDPAGRFWLGTLDYDLEEGSGNLFCVNSDLKVEKKLDQLTIPNGMAWNSKNDRFYFIDTIARKLYSYHYEIDIGEISDRSIIYEFTDDLGYPDGMTIDSNDKLWIALYAGSKVIQINPKNGDIEFEVRLPVPKPTSCTFGGEDFKTLFITTCREHMDESEIEMAPLSGSLFSVDLPFSGRPVDRFDG